MFTGIIQEIGIVRKIKKGNTATFTIAAKNILSNKKIGDSIAVNGVCVTITKIAGNCFKFDAMEETLKMTNLKHCKKNSKVNLEPALTLDHALDGHFVQGHIDAKGIMADIKKRKNSATLTIKFPPEIENFLAFKGSITVNGVSLTISNLQETTFSVELIPHTLKNTNLGKLKKNDIVNIETDMLARYINRLVDNKEKENKYYFLKEQNLI